MPPVTCLICAKKCKSIEEIAKHISDTGKGREGTIFKDLHEGKVPEEEYQQLVDASRGFAHVTYLDSTAKPIEVSEVMELDTRLRAGGGRCADCAANFQNNYRLHQHYVATGHDAIYAQSIKRSMIRLGQITAKWFGPSSSSSDL